MWLKWVKIVPNERCSKLTVITENRQLKKKCTDSGHLYFMFEIIFKIVCFFTSHSQLFCWNFPKNKKTSYNKKNFKEVCIMMDVRGIYEEKITKRKLTKLDEWRKVEGLGYRSVFEVEDGEVELRSEYEVSGFPTNDTFIFSEEELRGVSLYFRHPKNMTHQAVIEQLKGVLPNNCYDIKLAGDLCVFYYSNSGLRATELSKPNQIKALALHPSFFIEEIGVEMYVMVMTDIQSGESKIYFSHYFSRPILCEEEDEGVLYINEKDSLFKKEFNRYTDALDQLGWEHMILQEDDSIFTSSNHSKVFSMDVGKGGGGFIPKENKPTNLVLFPIKGHSNAMFKKSDEELGQYREPDLNSRTELSGEIELNNQPLLISELELNSEAELSQPEIIGEPEQNREQEHTGEKEHHIGFSEATEIISLFKMLPEKQRKVTLNYLIHML